MTDIEAMLKEARLRSAEYHDHDSELYMAGMDALSVNVNRGEIFLDGVDPEWYKKVNLSNLDMSDGSRCICGWVFKEMMQDGYQFFAKTYGEEYADEYGFMYDTNIDPYIPSGYQWSMLAELWVMKIEKRLANDGLMA